MPLRPGKIQGFAIFACNPSDLTEFITGSADDISPGAPARAEIAVYLEAAGGSQGTAGLQQRVRAAIARTEDIPPDAQVAVSASAATVQADRAYCRNRPPGS